MVFIGAVSLRSALSLGYLIIFGALIAFTAYSWLLRVTPPSLASTYAYVNPVVAVLWAGRRQRTAHPAHPDRCGGDRYCCGFDYIASAARQGSERGGQ